MKKMILGSMMALVLSTGTVFAAGKEITVGVKGMVCGFCAQGVEKKFSAEPAVDKVDVSLSEKRVKLTLKDGKDLDDELIKKILTDSGYNIEKIERK